MTERTTTSEDPEYTRRVEWLWRYQQAIRRQQLLEEELADRRAQAERITSVLSSAPRAPGSNADRLPRAVERILTAEDDVTAQLARCETARAEVLALIRAEPDDRAQELLYHRYIQGQTFEQIAENMHYSIRWAHRLHKRAVCGLALPAATQD